MEGKEKGMEREAKKQGLMVKKLKRRMLVGKRGGPCTPPPTWRLELSSHENDDTCTTNMQEFLTIPNNTASVSARKLGANLWDWEIQPHQHVPLRPAKLSKGVARPRHRYHRHKGFEVSQHLVDPPDSPPYSPASASQLRRHVAASPVRQHRSLQRNHCALQPLSPASYGSSLEVARYSPAFTPASSLDLKARMVESSNGLKTSTTLLKVLNRIWSLEEEKISNISLVKALKMELYHSQARIKELLEEKQSDRHEMGDLMKQVTVDKLVRKNKEQDQIKAAVGSIRYELEDEKKLRKHSESLHWKLARELSELKSSFSNALKELERERNVRLLLENLCDEFAKGIRDYEQEFRSLKHQTDKDGVGRENTDRLILHISEAWLDERMQMKLVEAQNDLAEKNTILDKLGFDIETFLQAKQSTESRKNGNLSPQELKNVCRLSRESFPLNETVSAPQSAADENSSTNGDSCCFELNKSTGGKRSKISSKQKDKNAAESHHKEILKSSSLRKKVGLWEINEVCNKSCLHGQFEEHKMKAMPCNGSRSQLAERQQGEMGGEKQDVINYLEKSGMREATQEDLQERCSRRVGTGGLKSSHVLDNLIRSHSLSLEGQSNCREDSCVQSVLTDNATPAQQWVSKLITPDPGKCESTLRWTQGLKEDTLMAKLLEARLEGQHSRLKSSKGSF
ncbi:hypothetical protein F2P56_026780 [Juglans regia]|uniref:Intracellular protein transport protein USO1-like n=2 Tax=Juglans regia TaxID=51240 RepID=A0A833UH41_JUGRE|nr:uncharacterized protein At5g41620-like [Juglans regia]KAF5451695.1 hypothetical protein F2P56_026780 [Juglans regia]